MRGYNKIHVVESENFAKTFNEVHYSFYPAIPDFLKNVMNAS